MNDASLIAVTSYMRDHWYLVTDDESAYKLAFRDKLAPIVDDAESGRRTWSDVIQAGRGGVSQLLGWRVGDQLHHLVREQAQPFDQAARRVVATQDADAFWDELAGAVGGEQTLLRYDKLKSAGARASVAAIVLFLHDPEQYPPFRPSNYAGPLARILDVRLDSSTPGGYLRDYYDGITRVRSALERADLPVRSNLDVQGVLWIVNYKGVVPRASK